MVVDKVVAGRRSGAAAAAAAAAVIVLPGIELELLRVIITIIPGRNA